MQEVFEKIRERLKNELHLAQEDCERYLNGNTNQFLYARARGYEVAMENAIEIVNQVAEEYQECALCYFGSPCEYQNKDARMPESELNNGWIPCSLRLPEVYEDTKSSDVVLVCGYDAEIDYSWQAMGFYVYTDAIKRWFFAECKDTDKPIDWIDIVAWQPLPNPYRKGK